MTVDAQGFKLMQPAHLAEIMAIEVRAYDFPWSEKNFLDCLSSRYHCWIYQPEDHIVAYGVLSAAAGEAHVLNLCVDPAHQHQGLGRRVLHFLLQVASEHSVSDVFLEVRDSNEPAKVLYESVGFNQYSVRHRYYPATQGREDAVLYCKAII
jgi:[ribosomal protein S18]-alanine N-acetyltransferase